ncbi:hypothetical protein [Streptomyces sp. NBC_01435]|uniref:hypothetical protein n=1 Tax=Streptomyces sp. NBC_01435 TaxID=2903865 RepID=UPI002E346678|nr:hypothetical protein [Streptomyces sp. NBC_01435]
MTPKQYSAPSVRQLAAVVDSMAGQVSEGRLRQLRMVVGMFDRAVGREEMPGRASRTAAQLFTWAALDGFWELAVNGELRARSRDRGTRLPLNTQDIVVDCLELLASHVVPDKTVRLPRVVSAAPRATTTSEQEQELFRFLVDMAGRQPVGHDGQSKVVNADYRMRLLAMTGVVVDTRSRPGELAGMRMADLGEGLRSVRVMRQPQNGAHLEPVEVVLPLSESTVTALSQWLRVRERLVYPLQGATDAVWVSVAASNSGEPPGLPLSPKSLGASYTRGVRALNGLMAGQPGWEPLPDRLEGLRRARVPAEEARVREVRAAEWEAAHPRRPVGRPPRLDRPIQHGREYSYTVLECRCDECTEAASFARKARRAEQRLRRAGG